MRRVYLQVIPPFLNICLLGIELSEFSSIPNMGVEADEWGLLLILAEAGLHP